MEKYTKQMVHFKGIFGKRVEVDFDGGEITSDAGLLFLRQTEDRTGILSRIAALIKIGARVRELKTRVKIHLPSSFPFEELFFQIWSSCHKSGYT